MSQDDVNGLAHFIRPTIPEAFCFTSTLSDGREVDVEAVYRPGEPGGLHSPQFDPDVEVEAVFDADGNDISDELNDDDIDALWAEAAEVRCKEAA